MTELPSLSLRRESHASAPNLTLTRLKRHFSVMPYLRAVCFQTKMRVYVRARLHNTATERVLVSRVWAWIA